MNYNILASGSTGNCTIVDNFIAIDMGIPFRQLKPYYKKLKIVFTVQDNRYSLSKRIKVSDDYY